MDPRALDHFREPDSVNKRLASWSPTDNSSRHFKFLLWNALEGMDDDFFTYTRCIRNRSLGNPTTVRYRTMDIDLDYMLAVDELLFLEKQNRILSRCRTVVEVGAGFGRTAHAILENFSQIDKYTIIDLPEMLQLSRLYLKTVIPERFSSLEFLSALDGYSVETTDLFINIDSFQEMEPGTIREYYDNVISRCRNIYIKNPVGKYLPEEFHIHNSLKSDKPFRLGLCLNSYTVCDQEAHHIMVAEYLKNYSLGGLELIDQRRCALFHYYHHALYINPVID
jgi:putative sugar O-methyltransferase